MRTPTRPASEELGFLLGDMRGPETVFASTWGPRREGVSACRAGEADTDE
jgi:hypothetical protein